MAFNPDAFAMVADTVGGGLMRVYLYESVSGLANILDVGYFENVEKFGVQLGDVVVVADPLSGMGSFCTVTNINAAGNATLSLSESQPESGYTLRRWGAIGDGVTDDAAAVTAAFEAAADGGYRLTGEGLTYAVAGNLDMPDGLYLQDASFFQLDPIVGNKTLQKLSGSGGVSLIRVNVDRGDVATAQTYGIWLGSGDEHYISDVEVTGLGTGAGIHLLNTTGSFFNRMYVHDLRYSDIASIDDVLSAIDVINVNDSHFLYTTIRRVTGDGGNVIWGVDPGGDTPINTRGISFASGLRNQIIGTHVEGTGEAIDFTGGSPKEDMLVLGGMCDTPMGYGLKIFGNDTTKRIVVTGMVVKRPGLPGIIIGGGADDCQLSNCLVVDAGYLSVTEVAPNLSTYGKAYWISGGSVNSYGMVLNHCRAIDTQVPALMEYGFGNETAYLSSKPKTWLSNCESFGHTIAKQIGFHEPIAYFYRENQQSLASGTPTIVNFAVTLYDTMVMKSSTSFITPAAELGIYYVAAAVPFTAQVGGNRTIELIVDSVVVQTVTEAATGAAQTLTFVPMLIDATAAAVTIQVQATQDSGNGIHIDFVGEFFTIRKID